MQKTLIYINAETKAQVDSSGAAVRKTSDMPTIERGQWQILCFQFLDVGVDEVGGVTLTPHNFSSNTTFVLSADDDFKDDNSLMLKSYSSVIPFDESNTESNRMNIEGDWIDGTTADLTKGQISFRINSDTVKFAECLGNAVSVSNNTYLSIKQYNTEVSNPSSIAWLKFVATNTIRDYKQATEEVPEGSALTPFVDAYLKRPMEFQYSSNGTDWHDTQTDFDVYYRMRITGIGIEWSDPIFIQYRVATNTVMVTELTDGKIKIAGTDTPPVMLQTNKGTLFDIKGATYLTITEDAFIIDPAPYLAADNSSSFEGAWKIWMASGTLATGSGGSGGVSEEVFSDFKTETYTTFTAINETLEYLEDETFGMLVKPVAAAEIPLVHSTVIKHTLTADEAITLTTSTLPTDRCVTMELWLTMPEEVVSFSIPDVTWIEEPSFDTANMLYCVVLRWDGAKVLANVAYSVEVG